MSLDMSSDLSLGASASASGAVTPQHTRSAGGSSGAQSPPSATEHAHHPPGGHLASPDSATTSGEQGQQHHAHFDDAEAERSGSGHTPHGHDSTRELVKGHPRVTRQQHGKQVDVSERRTVFIPNCPRDATQREMTNLFCFCEGFLKVSLYDQKQSNEKEGVIGGQQVQTPPGGSSPPVSSPGPLANGGRELTQFGCFALFETVGQAAAARERLHGYVFDATVTPPVVLQARIALKNLVLTREEQEAAAATHALAAHVYSSKSSRRSSMNYLAVPNGHSNPIPSDSSVSPFQNAAVGGHFSPLHSPQPQSGAYIHSGYGSPALGPYSQQQQLTPPAITTGPGYYSDSSLHVPGGVFNALYQSNLNGGSVFQHAGHPNGTQSNGFAAANGGATNGSQHHPHNGRHHGHHGHSQAGPNNPPCTTLFIARLDLVSDDDLLALLYNTFGGQMIDSKLMVDSRGQRIAFVEFDSIESSAAALPRIHGYMGLSCAFSKNPLNKRLQ